MVDGTSALLELYQYVDAPKGQEYKDAALNMLSDLSSDRYQSCKKTLPSSCIPQGIIPTVQRLTPASSTQTITISKPFSN